MKLSLTVLCFNEEESIPKFYDAACAPVKLYQGPGINY